MNQSESIGKLASALCRAQSEIKVAEMNALNPFLKNKYADLGSVIEAVRPALADNALSFSQLVGGNADGIALTTILMHESGEYISDTIQFPFGEEKGRSLAQSAGAIITYLRRYALSSLLGVYADEDVDGNGGKPTTQPKKKPTQSEPVGNGHRPLKPEDLADALERKAKTYQGRTASDKQRGLCAGMMSVIFADDIDKHSVQEFLFGATSLTDVTDEQVLAALDWLKPEKDDGGAFVPDKMAIKEAQTVLSHVLTLPGQQALGL